MSQSFGNTFLMEITGGVGKKSKNYYASPSPFIRHLRVKLFTFGCFLCGYVSENSFFFNFIYLLIDVLEFL